MDSGFSRLALTHKGPQRRAVCRWHTPKGKRATPLPAWGRHFGTSQGFQKPIRAVSCRAEPCYLANIYLALSELRTNHCHFSLIINGELQTQQNQPTHQRSPGGAKLQPASGHERLNISCSSSPAAQNKLKPSGKTLVRSPPARGPREPGIHLSEAGRAALPLPQEPKPAALPAHNLGCCSSGLLCSLLNVLFSCKPIRPFRLPGRAVGALGRPSPAETQRLSRRSRTQKGVGTPGGVDASLPGLGPQSF